MKRISAPCTIVHDKYKSLYLQISHLVPMAIFIPGMLCHICGKEMTELDDIYLFPAFVCNAMDPLFSFSDNSVHEQCLQTSPTGQLAITYVEQMFAKTLRPNKRCDITGEPILRPEDYFFIPLITSDPDEELSRFAFTQMHIRNVSRWKERSLFVDLAQAFLEEGKFATFKAGYNPVEHMIGEINRYMGEEGI